MAEARPAIPKTMRIGVGSGLACFGRGGCARRLAGRTRVGHQSSDPSCSFSSSSPSWCALTVLVTTTSSGVAWGATYTVSTWTTGCGASVAATTGADTGSAAIGGCGRGGCRRRRGRRRGRRPRRATRRGWRLSGSLARFSRSGGACGPTVERNPPPGREPTMRVLTERPPALDRWRRPPAQCAAMRVLVVEDEPKMAALIRRVLVAERHVVDVAPDGVSAIALAEAAPYDVAVLDRGLPDIDGITVMRLLRAKGIATPVLLLTALGSVDDRVAGLDAGRGRLPRQAVRLLGAAGPHPGARPTPGSRRRGPDGGRRPRPRRAPARRAGRRPDGGPVRARVRAPGLLHPPCGPGRDAPADPGPGVGRGAGRLLQRGGPVRARTCAASWASWTGRTACGPSAAWATPSSPRADAW